MMEKQLNSLFLSVSLALFHIHKRIHQAVIFDIQTLYVYFFVDTQRSYIHQYNLTCNFSFHFISCAIYASITTSLQFSWIQWSLFTVGVFGNEIRLSIVI